MTKNRVDRLNSLLKEVISEVIRQDVKNPHIHGFLTVTAVSITKDLHYAKVHISIIGSEQEKQETMKALQSAAKFIAVNASKKVVMRYFPDLQFKLDEGVEQQMRVEELLKEITEEREKRETDEDDQ